MVQRFTVMTIKRTSNYGDIGIQWADIVLLLYVNSGC